MARTTATLRAEFAAATAAAKREHFDALIAHGVASKYLWHGPMRFGVSAITADDTHYQPSEGRGMAFIMPLIPLVAPWEAGFPVTDVGDLIAWLPHDPSRWWRRRGLLPLLNPCAVERAGFMREALRVWSTPLAWLRAGGDGIVILDETADLSFWLGGVGTIHADTLALGETIERRLRASRSSAPRVLVPSGST